MRLPFLLGISSSLVLITACGGGGGASSTSSSSSNSGATSTPKPGIQSFSATPSVISSGQSTSLTWAVSGATTVTLNGAAVSGTSSSVSPTTTTVYTLTATNSQGTTTATATVTVGAMVPHYGSFSGADLGPGAALNGAISFPADNAWNTDISNAPVDPNSANLIASIGANTSIHPDFGSGLYQGAPIGIPYIVVPGTQAPVATHYSDFADESDPGPFPIPADAPIEGQMADGSAFGGDRHVIVIDRDHNRLYELGNAYPQSNGSWNATGGYKFFLDSNNVRPGGQPGWTSADAAGLPIFPGLVRYEEAAAGLIPHAVRFTVAASRKAYVPPATHYASSNTSANLPPMGMRVRLKSSFVIDPSFTKESKAIMQALKTYGMIVADNGSNWYINGAPDPRWNNSKLLSELGTLKGSNFEVIQMTGLVAP
jgi:hypothetical protein